LEISCLQLKDAEVIAVRSHGKVYLSGMNGAVVFGLRRAHREGRRTFLSVKLE
jgi:hypothetical protein